MNYRVIITLLVVILGLSLTIKALHNRLKVEKEKTSMLAINLKSEQRKTTYWIDKDSLQHASVVEQQRTIADLKRGKDSLSTQIRDLSNKYNISLKKLNEYGEVKTSVEYVIKEKLDSSIIGCHTLLRKDLKQVICITKDSISSSVEIESDDNIFIYKNKETIDPPYKFFLWRWFQRKQEIATVEIVRGNPAFKTKSIKFTQVLK